MSQETTLMELQSPLTAVVLEGFSVLSSYCDLFSSARLSTQRMPWIIRHAKVNTSCTSCGPACHGPALRLGSGEGNGVNGVCLLEDVSSK